MEKQIRFFLGGHGAGGFASFFDGLDSAGTEGEKIILKGGPGSGKSTIMRRVAAALESRGREVERISCASDPDSLDAVTDGAGRVTVVDGTAPHAIEPRCPGAWHRTVDTGLAWDEGMLRQRRSEICALEEQIRRLHSAAGACAAGAGALLDRNRAEAEALLDRDALQRAARELAADWPRGGGARQRVRMLTALSAGRVLFLQDTVRALADVIYEIRDPWGAAAEALVEELLRQALDRELSVILSPGVTAQRGRWEHLLLPELGVAVTRADAFQQGEWKPWSVHPMEAERWMKPGDREEMGELLTAAQSLLEQGAQQVARAGGKHAELEAIYGEAMDREKLDRMTEQLLQQLE